MRSLSARILVSLIATATLLLGGEVLTLKTASEQLPCERASAWVEANATRLPQARRDIAAFPAAYQKAIFANLTKEQKAALWRERLAELRTNGDYSDRQRELVDRALALISPVIYDRTSRQEVPSTVRELETAFKGAFTKSQLVAFTRLTDSGQVRHQYSSLLVGAREWALAHLVANAQEAPESIRWCVCSISSEIDDWACWATGGAGVCIGGHSPRCTPSPFGCGFEQIFPCDGLCS